MTPVDHDSCTDVWFVRGARRQQQHGHSVGQLPVMRDASGFVSYWKPTPLELSRLQAGGVVALRVYGQLQPVVTLNAEAL